MKTSILDFIRWDGEIGVLAYRHPKINISNNHRDTFEMKIKSN